MATEIFYIEISETVEEVSIAEEIVYVEESGLQASELYVDAKALSLSVISSTNESSCGSRALSMSTIISTNLSIGGSSVTSAASSLSTVTSVSDSKAVIADSKAESASTRASVGDSKAVSVSVLTSTADSKAESASTRASTADSKAESLSTILSGTSVLVQMVKSESTTLASTTEQFYYGTSAEGEQWATLSITPTSATNILQIDVKLDISDTTVYGACVGLFKDTDTSALVYAVGNVPNFGYNAGPGHVFIRHTMVAGTTDSITFKVRFGSTAPNGIAYINGYLVLAMAGEVGSSSIIIKEFTP